MKLTKDEKRTLCLTTIVCLIPVIAGIILYPQLPDTIATHWDGQGNVNGISSKLVGAIVCPGILLLVNLLMPFLLKTDPKYANMNAKLKTLVQWIIPLVCLFSSASTLANGMGYGWRVEITGPMLVGLVLVLIGNLMPKTRQSYTMGIKLPWTLNSEENWNHTHRFGGFVWVVCGILMIISAMLPQRVWLFGVLAAVAVLAPSVYSYLYYRRECGL